MMSEQIDLDPIDNLLSAAIAEPAERYAFYRSLLEHELLVIGTVSDESTLHLKYIDIGEGQTVLPVYSSLDKFQTVYGTAFPYIKIPAYMLLEAVELTDPWVLNPGFVPSKMIIPEELQTLKDGTIFDYCWEQLGDQQRKAVIEERQMEWPEQAMQVLIQCLRAAPSVRQAYVTTLYQPSAGEKLSPLVGLELDDLNRETASALIQSISESVRDKLPMDPAIEFVILDDEAPFAKSMKEQLRPIYVRTTIEDMRSMFR
jgi:SseB protein.